MPRQRVSMRTRTASDLTHFQREEPIKAWPSLDSRPNGILVNWVPSALCCAPIASHSHRMFIPHSLHIPHRQGPGLIESEQKVCRCISSTSTRLALATPVDTVTYCNPHWLLCVCVARIEALLHSFHVPTYCARVPMRYAAFSPSITQAT